MVQGKLIFQGALAAGVGGLLLGAWLAVGLQIRGENLLNLPAPTHSCDPIVNVTHAPATPEDFGY